MRHMGWFLCPFPGMLLHAERVSALLCLLVLDSAWLVLQLYMGVPAGGTHQSADRQLPLGQHFASAGVGFCGLQYLGCLGMGMVCSVRVDFAAWLIGTIAMPSRMFCSML